MKVFVVTRRMLAVAAVVLAVGALLFILHAAGATDLVAAVSAKRELPIYSVDTDNKLVALSFDAAWADASYVQRPAPNL